MAQEAAHTSILTLPVYRKVPEGYIGFIEELRRRQIRRDGPCEEARANLREAAQLVLEANRSYRHGKTLTRTSIIREPASDRCGVKRRELVRHLEQHGCRLLREGSNHTLIAETGKVHHDAAAHREINELPGRGRSAGDLGVPEP